MGMTGQVFLGAVLLVAIIAGLWILGGMPF